MTIAANDRIYLQPTAFVTRPHGLEGRVERIGDSLIWFTAYQLIWRSANGGARTGEALVAVDALEGWLADQPVAIRTRVEAQRRAITTPLGPVDLGGSMLRFDAPMVMGIVNATPDSFSDGGLFDDAGEAAAAGFAMQDIGAAIIDVGGESTRPGAVLVEEKDEIARVIPVVRALAAGGAIVSIDSRKGAVMSAALAAGAHMVNDVAALAFDDAALDVVIKADCPVVLMHAPSQGVDPHKNQRYGECALDVYDWLEARAQAVIKAGVKPDNILVDPGIGFGKSLTDNLAILNATAMFHGLGYPLLIAASRKRLIGALDNDASTGERLGGSVALHLLAADQGAHIVRAHDVKETVQALRMWRGLREAAMAAPYANGEPRIH